MLEELLTKARTLNDDSGYDPAFKEETLWDTLVFGLRSDKGKKDAISKRNSFTFQQVYDLAKTEESTKAQMQAITRGYQVGSVHSVRRKQKSDAPAPRLKQVKVISQNPDYRGQDIYLLVNDEEERDYCGDSSEDSEPITVVLNTITSENTVDVVSSNPERIITTVKINDTRSIPMKVDTGADTCVLTTDYLQRLGLCLDIKPCNVVRKSYGGNTITNLCTSALKITFKGNSASANFHIVTVAFQLPERRPWQE